MANSIFAVFTSTAKWMLHLPSSDVSHFHYDVFNFTDAALGGNHELNGTAGRIRTCIVQLR
ncbi:MAG: hypothetical protein MN733_02630, partial [Nitrososphaera sp.]|nr:hypothetical protein [Nitrososphaera sp.]